jgi:hypothetical protein
MERSNPYSSSSQPVTQSASRKRRRRIFLWFFLAAQALFIIWIAAGAASSGGSCHGLSVHDCATVSDAGHGIAVVVQVVAWVVFDVIVGGGYCVYRLARRV